MGYFFRPRTRGFTRSSSVENHKEVMNTLEKLNPSPPNNPYSLGWGEYRRRETASWSWWGWFIHDEEYYDIITDLFIIHKDEYGDNLYELKRPNFDDDFTREYFEKIWTELEAVRAATSDFGGVDAEDIKDSLEYIMFSGWDFFEAY